MFIFGKKERKKERLFPTSEAKQTELYCRGQTETLFLDRISSHRHDTFPSLARE
jgi:hypothetical protein